jgi:hypothetical protein
MFRLLQGHIFKKLQQDHPSYLVLQVPEVDATPQKNGLEY